MKCLNRLFLFVFIISLQLNLYSAPEELSSKEQEELKLVAGQLIDMMNPNASPEERESLISQTVQQTIEMDSKIKNLPEEERIAFEKDLNSFIYDPNNPLKDFINENFDQPQEEPEQEISEEPVQEPLGEEVGIKDIQEVKEILDSIVARIGSLLVKIKSLPRLSSDKQVEAKWHRLKQSLSTLESLLKIAAKKDNLLKVLISPDYDDLRSSLIKFKQDFSKKEIAFKVPDTAGLIISYEEDDEEDNIEFEDAQKKLKEIMDLVVSLFDKDIIKNLKEFFEKHDPEELKKNSELKGSIEKFEQQFVPSNDIPLRNRSRSGRNYANNYNPSSVGYNPLYDPGLPYFDGGYPSFGSDGSLDSGSKGKASKDGNNKSEDDSKSKEDKSKKDSKDKEKKKDKDKDKSPADKQIDDFKTAIRDLDKSLTKANISEVVAFLSDKSLKKSAEDLLKIRDLPSNLIEVERNYQKAIKSATKANTSIKILAKDAQEDYKSKLKEVYSKSELENHYDNIIKNSSVIKKSLPKDQVDKIESLIGAHQKLRDIVDITKQIDAKKKAESQKKSVLPLITQEQYIEKQEAELKEYLSKLSKSLGDLDIDNLFFNIQSSHLAKTSIDDIGNLSKILSDSNDNYDKIIKLVNHLEVSLSDLPKKMYTGQIELVQKLYNQSDLKLEKYYSSLVQLLDVIKDSKSSVFVELKSKIEDLIKSHDKIKEAIGLKEKSK